MAGFHSARESLRAAVAVAVSVFGFLLSPGSPPLLVPGRLLSVEVDGVVVPRRWTDAHEASWRRRKRATKSRMNTMPIDGHYVWDFFLYNFGRKK